jgi:hypothetical protein
VQPALVVCDLDAVTAGDWLVGLEVATAYRAQNCVVGEAGTARDLMWREDVDGGRWIVGLH